MEILFDLDLVAARRERAATKPLPGADFLLELAGRELAERLDVVERRFEQAVELHGATGIAARLGLGTGKIEHLTRVETGAVFAGAGEQEFVTAALEDVPLAPQSTNLVLSPLALHLTNDTPGMLVRIRRALKPDGLFLAAIPGAGTLAELRDVLLTTEAELLGGASPRVIPFPDVRDIGALLQRAGFALPVADAETYTVRYESIFDLIRDLRATGMTNPLAGRARRPLNRAFLMRAAEIYAQRYADPDGRIRATFAMIYVSGWAPHENQPKPLKPGSATVRLADALKGRPG
ncbi:methyltransferase domain-containing protein [Neorhizobium sp. NPDC001467]|uniref:methyltransferase domain-containing protein n=1 Tax=Neorhizobium sp. NPDC001467 TaxID=3390595 RepID=UPI003CFF2882